MIPKKVVTLTQEELDEMAALAAKGDLPPTAIKDYEDDVARNVFGHDAKKDAKGNYIEQGIGARGRETANHFATILRHEQLGLEPPGAHARALEEIWRRDPKRAEALRLPRPRAAA